MELDQSLLRRMNTQIFQVENERNPTGSDWVPGDPLWDRPNYSQGEQFIRPMFQLMDDKKHLVTVPTGRCDDCDVFWDSLVDGLDCWMCGKTCETGWPAQAPMSRDELYAYSRARSYVRASDEDYVYARASANVQDYIRSDVANTARFYNRTTLYDVYAEEPAPHPRPDFESFSVENVNYPDTRIERSTDTLAFRYRIQVGGVVGIYRFDSPLESGDDPRYLEAIRTTRQRWLENELQRRNIRAAQENQMSVYGLGLDPRPINTEHQEF